MVENNFSGVLFLEEIGNLINGHWISPNTKEQHKVELKKVTLERKAIEELEDTYEKLYYNINGGC